MAAGTGPSDPRSRGGGLGERGQTGGRMDGATSGAPRGFRACGGAVKAADAALLLRGGGRPVIFH